MTGQPRILVLAAALAVTAGAAAARPLVAGFYLPWDTASRASLVAHADRLDILAPMSGALVSPQGAVRWQDDPARAPALAKAHGRPKVFPVVSNAHDNVWDTAASDGVLLDDQAGETFIRALVAQAQAQGYGGYVLDLENLSPKSAPAYAPFLAKLRQALQPGGRELWVTASLAADPTFVQQLAAAADTVVLMAYDQCWATSTPGPVAGQDWLERTLDAKLSQTDRAHYVVALGAYGYDWPTGEPAAVISAPAAAELAKARGQAPARATPDANPHFAYRGAQGDTHTVWYLDAAAFKAQRAAVDARRARGVAIWRLGLEDPAIWSKTLAAHPTGLATAAPGPACVALPPSR